MVLILLCTQLKIKWDMSVEITEERPLIRNSRLKAVIRWWIKLGSCPFRKDKSNLFICRMLQYLMLKGMLLLFWYWTVQGGNSGGYLITGSNCLHNLVSCFTTFYLALFYLPSQYRISQTTPFYLKSHFLFFLLRLRHEI